MALRMGMVSIFREEELPSANTEDIGASSHYRVHCLFLSVTRVRPLSPTRGLAG